MSDDILAQVETVAELQREDNRRRRSKYDPEDIAQSSSALDRAVGELDLTAVADEIRRLQEESEAGMKFSGGIIRELRDEIARLKQILARRDGGEFEGWKAKPE